MRKLRYDILCILGAQSQSQIPLIPSLALTCQFFKFTYSHDCYLELAIENKYRRYDPLLDTLKQKDGRYSPSSSSKHDYKEQSQTLHEQTKRLQHPQTHCQKLDETLREVTIGILETT